MALIQCFECGAQVSDLAKSCPQCGAPLKCERQKNRQHNNSYVGNEHCQQYASSQRINSGWQNGSDSYGQAAFSSYPRSTRYSAEVSKLTFGDAVSECFRKYATFSGRARRSEYWFFCLFNMGINFGLGCFLSVFLGDEDGIAIGIMIIIALFRLAVFLPGLSVYVRRLHDIGKSGANIFWALLPIVGWIMIFVWLLQDSEEYENEYGPSPKYN